MSVRNTADPCRQISPPASKEDGRNRRQGVGSAIPPRQHRLLSRFYDRVEKLPAYLVRILPDHAKAHIEQTFASDASCSTSSFAARWTQLVHALVGTRHGTHNQERRWDDWKVPTAYDALSGGTMSELVQQAQTRLLRGGAAAGASGSAHMLTLGYREADDRLAGLPVRIAGSTALTNVYVNSHVGEVMLGREWHHLLERVGPAVMLHLLTQTSLFVTIADGGTDNLMQILGPSLSALTELPKEEVSMGDDGSRKLLRKTKRKRSTRSKDREERVGLSLPIARLKRSETMQNRSKSDSALTLHPGVLKASRPASLRKPRKISRKASEIQIMRSQLFYARAIRTRTGKVASGLPMVHIFNRTTPKEILLKRDKKKAQPWMTTCSKIEPLTIDKKTLASRSRRVLNYIWPRQHGLHNAFTGKDGRVHTTGSWQNYVNREEALRRRGSLRTPKRLQTAARLVGVMLAKHDRLDYGRLLRYCCPSSLPSSRLTQADRADILFNLSEASTTQAEAHESQIMTQPTSLRQDVLATNSKIRRGHPSVHKPSFTKYKAATGAVSRFAQAVIRQVLPIELIGSHHNLGNLLQNVDKFVRLRRYETLNLHQLCQGVRASDCQWLLPRNKRALQQRPTEDEMKKRHDLLHELMYYLFDSFLIPLLRTNFYATESAALRNRTIFFRQDDWQRITQPILEKFKAGCFDVINKNEAIGIMSGRDFGYSFVRLLPKLNGVRPIVNLRRRSVKINRNTADPTQSVQQQQSINNILSVTFRVLNYEKRNSLASLGSSVFGAQDIHEKLQGYQASLLARHKGIIPRLYFVKMDVTCAFDSIDQEILLGIVQDIVRHDRYVIQKFCQVLEKGERASKSWPRLACAEVEQEPFSTMLGQYSSDFSNAVFSDSVIYTHCERGELLRLLEEHISNNLIKVGKDFCRQRVGIPQGSSLSTLLCCYYLAKLEREKKLCDDEESLLMRYTDDFLYISPNQDKARRFYDTMKQGDSTFNLHIAVEKSLHTLDLGVSDESSRLQGEGSSRSSHLFPWCSYLINVKTLSVEYDMSRYAHSCLADTLTIQNKQPFQSLLKVMQSSIRNRNLAIFLDVRLNGVEVVIGNLYRNFLLAALKVVSCYREVKRISGMRKNDSQFIPSILMSIRMCYASMQNKERRSTGHDMATTTGASIDRDTFTLLALHAFARIFALRPSSRQWAVPLREEIRCSTRLQYVQRRYKVDIQNAWLACKSMLETISV